MTRPQVSRLLKRARAEGIVEIRIVDATAVDAAAGEELRRRFGLAGVHLSPALAASPLLGQHSQEVLKSWLELSDAELDGLTTERVISGR